MPKNLPATSKQRTGAGRIVYSVTALMMSMKREDDSDIHVVIADPIHGQAGVAPNGIELHPVLTFTSTNCQRVTVNHRG